MATTERIEENSAATPHDLAEEERTLIGEAISRSQPERFWSAMEESVERLRADPDTWQGFQREARTFEGASMDGLEDEEPYCSVEDVKEILG